ncbi:MAG: DUF4879 domain-containing protein [Sphingomonas taxi]
MAQSAPPLTAVQIVAVTSATQAERIAADQQTTTRRHTGPVTIVVREVGIGSARLVRVDGAPLLPPSTTRGLCGPAVTPGACRPGEPLTGAEITYHFDALPSGTTVAVQDTSATLPAQTLTATITLR